MQLLWLGWFAEIDQEEVYLQLVQRELCGRCDLNGQKEIDGGTRRSLLQELARFRQLLPLFLLKP